MAKGRKLTTSRSERLLGSYSYGHSEGSTGTDVSELGEEDVWSMVDDLADRGEQIESNSHEEWTPRAGDENNGVVAGSTWSRRRIPRDERHIGGLSLAFEDLSVGGGGGEKMTSSRIVHQFRGNDRGVASPRGYQMATSAPVNVPDWSKILRVDSVESLHDSDEWFDDHDSEMVPPHEYLAREYARSRKMGGASVVEGVGRTLKGRDMRRVRDAIWSQTGVDG